MEGIGERTEQALWSSGILSWGDCSGARLEKAVGSGAASKIGMWAEKSIESLDSGDHSFFSRTLPLEHAWRGLYDFPGRIGYLDIETNGLSPQYSKVTVVGIYDGEDVHTYVNGDNMDELFADLPKYSVLVTFNGRAFDIPFLKKHYPMINFNHLHVDLRPVLKTLGITGGLKKIETIFGMERKGDMAGLTGYDAVRMWNRYEYSGDKAALDRLIRYNAEDIVHLEPLAKWAFGEKSAALKEKMKGQGAGEEGTGGEHAREIPALA